MWVAVIFIFNWSVYSGTRSTARWSAEYVDRSWRGFEVSTLVINKGKRDSMWCGFHFIHKVLPKVYNSRLVVQCGSMIYTCAKSSSAPIMHFFVRNIPHTVVSHAFSNKNRHVHASAQAHGRPFLTLCVNTVNIRNVFYYGLWICPIQQQNTFEIGVVCVNVH
jgi:hypothetical protein